MPLRWTALVSVALALYVVVGCRIYGPWWYGLFWGREKKLRYIRDALAWLAQVRFKLTMCIVAGAFVVTVVFVLLGPRVFPIIDRFSGLLIFTALMAIFASAIVIYRTQRQPYEKFMHATAMLARAIEDLQRMSAMSASPPKIEPPIYFHYLDRERIEALYNQIQPDLEEQQRTVGGSTTVRGEAKAGIGGTSLGMEAAKAGQSSSTFARSAFSPDRKCFELMSCVRNNWPERYYSTDADWYFRPILRDVSNVVSKALDSQTPQGRLQQGTPSIGDVERQAKRRQVELKAELEALAGLVFVCGEFAQSTSDGRVRLVEKFSTEPFICSFRTSLPKQDLEGLPTEGVLRLTVFADVTRPLGYDGYVELKAIAAY